MIRYALMALGPASIAALAVASGMTFELAGAVGIGAAFVIFLVSELVERTAVESHILRNDIVHALLSAATAQICLLVATLVISIAPTVEHAARWPLWLQVPLIVLGTDLLGYWGHRAQHKISVLWRPHAVHHMPHKLYALNGLRAHPGDTAFAFTVSTVWVLAIGFAQEAFVIASVLQTSFLLLQHASGRFPTWLEKVFVTPAWHAVHHDRTGTVANLAHVITLWDRVFRTFEASRPVSPGIDGSPPDTLTSEILLRMHK